MAGEHAHFVDDAGGLLVNPLRALVEIGEQSERRRQEAERQVRFLDDPHDETLYGRQVGDRIEWMHKTQPRRHEVYDLASFGLAVSRWAEESEECGVQATVWVGADEVLLVCDDYQRLDRVRLPFTPTEARCAVEELVHSSPLEQKKLVWLLRTTLREAIPPDDLLRKVDNLRWNRGAEGESNIGHGAESLRATTIAKVEGTEQIPEEVVAKFRWWAELDHQATVDVAVDVDAAERKFVLRPVGDSLRRAQVGALQQLRDLVVVRLKEEGVLDRVTVFCGEA